MSMCKRISIYLLVPYVRSIGSGHLQSYACPRLLFMIQGFIKPRPDIWSSERNAAPRIVFKHVYTIEVGINGKKVEQNYLRSARTLKRLCHLPFGAGIEKCY
jgi:hypothetical protein